MDFGNKRPTAERKSKVTYQYHPDIGHYHYGEKHYMKPARVKMAHSLVTGYGLQKKMEVSTPSEATFKEMAKFHSDDYLDFLRRVTPEDAEEIQKSQARFNVGEYCPDCPIFEGLYDFCSISAGGSIAAAKKLNQGHADIGINWGGGLHHAKRGEASGFCYVNDIVLAILELLKYHQRVLYIDTDVHHGDGVEEAFYTSDRVMAVSFHKFGEFFPGTGALNDVGIGKGRHYSINVPLNDGIDDKSYETLFRSVISHVMQWYRPGAVVLQLGADSLVGDRLGAFNLSMQGHAQSVEFMKTFNVPLILLGGGGYTVRNVARAWCYETSLAVGTEVSEDLPYHEYYEYYTPEYRLDIPASNMENLNTREYLEKINIAVIENLRHVAHAPSVQMHNVPYDQWSSDDEQENKDDRITQSMSDKYRVPDNALSDSEDETGGRRDRQSYRNNARAKELRERDSASATPGVQPTASPLLRRTLRENLAPKRAEAIEAANNLNNGSGPSNGRSKLSLEDGNTRLSPREPSSRPPRRVPTKEDGLDGGSSINPSLRRAMNDLDVGTPEAADEGDDDDANMADAEPDAEEDDLDAMDIDDLPPHKQTMTPISGVGSLQQTFTAPLSFGLTPVNSKSAPSSAPLRRHSLIMGGFAPLVTSSKPGTAPPSVKQRPASAPTNAELAAMMMDSRQGSEDLQDEDEDDGEDEERVFEDDEVEDEEGTENELGNGAVGMDLDDGNEGGNDAASATDLPPEDDMEDISDGEPEALLATVTIPSLHAATVSPGTALVSAGAAPTPVPTPVPTGTQPPPPQPSSHSASTQPPTYPPVTAEDLQKVMSPEDLAKWEKEVYAGLGGGGGGDGGSKDS